MPTSPTPWIRGSILLLLTTLVVYFPTYGPIYAGHGVAGFVWDDDELLVNNPNIRDLQGLRRAWFEPANHGTFYPDYYPLTYTSWWLEYKFAGINAQVFHFDNVLLHAGNAILIWVILNRLGVPGAGLAAAIFAVHPIEVESVAWISERKNVLSGLFFLLAAWTFIEAYGLGAADDAAPRRPRLGLLGLSLVFFVLAMFAKPVAMTLAGVLPLIVWLKRGRFDWRTLAAAGPYLLLALPMAWLTMWFQRHHIALRGQMTDYSLVTRGLIAGRVIWFYAGKLVWPFNFSFAYAQWQIDPAVWWQWIPPLAAVAALAGLWMARRRFGQAPLLAALYFVITLSPALGFVPILWHRYYFVADHVQYLAGIGLIALAAAAATVWGKRAIKAGVLAPGPATMAVAILLCALGAATFAQGHVYENSFTLWTDVLRKNPDNWMADNNLAVIYLQRNQAAFARPCLEHAVALKPDFFDAQYNLGLLLSGLGDSQQAVDHFRAALAARPDLLRARRALAQELAKLAKHSK